MNHRVPACKAVASARVWKQKACIFPDFYFDLPPQAVRDASLSREAAVERCFCSPLRESRGISVAPVRRRPPSLTAVAT